MDTTVVDTLITQFPAMDLVSFQTMLGVIATVLVIPIVKLLRPVIEKLPIINPALLNTVVCFGLVFGCRAIFYPALDNVAAIGIASTMKLITGDLFATWKEVKKPNGTG